MKWWTRRKSLKCIENAMWYVSVEGSDPMAHAMLDCFYRAVRDNLGDHALRALLRLKLSGERTDSCFGREF